MEENEEEIIDLFPLYETLPEDIQAILFKYWEELENGDGNRYEVCAEFLEVMESHGYTFDYGLDAVPFDLHKIENKE